VIDTTTGARWVSVARLSALPPPDSVTDVRCEGHVLAPVNTGRNVSALENTPTIAPATAANPNPRRQPPVPIAP